MIKRGTKILDIEKTMAEMTLEEKARLVCASTFFGATGIERLGISRMQFLDGGTGMNFEQYFGDMLDLMTAEETDKPESTNGMVGSNSLVRVIEYFFEPERLLPEDLPLYEMINSRLCKLVSENINYNEKNINNGYSAHSNLIYSPGCYPPGIVLGSTWNPEVVHKVGQALGLDSAVFGVDMLLGSPNVNIHRDPLNGRLFEGYSEDPVLVSMLAPELVKGVQEYGIAADVKHFAANNQESYRTGIDETIPKRALEEIYFPGFKACVEAGVVSLMSAYNKINGVPCTENYDLLTKKIREEWGFDGMIISDWGAVKDIVSAIKAGNDFATPGPYDYKPIIEAVQNGSMDIAALDKAVCRTLKTINWIVENKKTINMSVEDITKFTNEAAYASAVESIVLLENNGVLPLAGNENIAILGSPSYDNCGAIKPLDTIIECGSGSAGINTDRMGSLSESISAYASMENVSLGEVREDTDIMLYVVKIPGMEGNDKKTLCMSEYDIENINMLCTKKSGFGRSKRLILVLNTSGPVEFTGIDEAGIDGLLVMFLPGMEGCHALADILFGKANPSGKLPLTFPKRYEDTPTYINFPGDGYNVTYGEGIYVGYRYYDKKKVMPKYHFGYGLSYTDFECKLKDAKIEEYSGNLKNVKINDIKGNNIKENNIKENDIDIKGKCNLFNAHELKSKRLHMEVCVKNTGNVFGSEVIQIYVGDVFSTLSKPVKELKDFKKVAIKPGEEKQISFDICLDRLASYDTDIDMWTVEEGYYDIFAATSSAKEDIFGEARVYVDVKSPYTYGVNSIIKVLYEHSQLKDAMYGLWQEYGFEEGILNSNYQYTANNKLIDIIPLKNPAEVKEFEERFMDRIKDIKKA